MTILRTNPAFTLAEAEELDNRLGYPKFTATLADGSTAQVSLGTLLYNLIAARDDLASTASGKGASMIGVQDAGGNLTATDVEAALAELYTAATSGGSDAITDTNNYYTTDTVDGALDALGQQIGGDTDATFNFTEANVLADNDALYAALQKLDLKWGDLANTANGEGASLVGIEDAGGNFTATNLELALSELADTKVKIYTTSVSTADLNVGATSQAVALAGFPANCFPIAAAFDLVTEFSGGGAGSCTAELGDTADPNELAASTNIFTGAGTGLKDSKPTAHMGFETAYAPELLITSDVNVDTLTAGEILVSIAYRTILS